MYEKIFLVLAVILLIILTVFVFTPRAGITTWAFVVSGICFIGWGLLCPISGLLLVWRMGVWEKNGWIELREDGKWYWKHFEEETKCVEH